MSNVPDNLRYTKDHEWLRLADDGTAVVGITDHAQESLGDITFVELPEADSKFGAQETFGVVESVKAASDLYMPVGGTILEVNDEIEDGPDMVNNDPYGEGWMVRIQLDHPKDAEMLMSPEDYRGIIE